MGKEDAVVTIPEFPRRDRRPTKISLRKDDGLRAQIETGNLPNTKQECQTLDSDFRYFVFSSDLLRELLPCRSVEERRKYVTDFINVSILNC